LYGECYGHSGNILEPSSGSDFEFDRNDDINVYEPFDYVTSDRRGNVQLDGWCNASKRYERHNDSWNIYGEYD